jgi:hypothetical protein
MATLGLGCVMLKLLEFGRESHKYIKEYRKLQNRCQTRIISKKEWRALGMGLKGKVV